MVIGRAIGSFFLKFLSESCSLGMTCDIVNRLAYDCMLLFQRPVRSEVNQGLATMGLLN